MEEGDTRGGVVKRGIVDELHRQARKHFPKRHVYVKSVDDLWQIDLIDMQKHARANGGHRYILTVIDVLSKYAWTEPVRNKSAPTVAAAMEKVLKRASPRRPNNVQSDEGLEFLNSQFAKLMKRHGINHYHTYSPLKASVCERLIRTLKTWLFKEFVVQGDYKWTKLLPHIVSRYNRRVHRTIGMRPVDVKDTDSKRLAHKLNSRPVPKATHKTHFKVGDTVRISKYKTRFEKGYVRSWSTELFKVVHVRRTVPPVYTLHDLKGNRISGTFYTEELQKTKYPDHYLVERVLRRKGDKVYVKWLGLDASHNSWI